MNQIASIHADKLLPKVKKVFKQEILEEVYSPMQSQILDGLIADSIVRHKGDASKVTEAELEGMKDLMRDHFGLAEAQVQQ